jgi:hypothetical protein
MRASMNFKRKKKKNARGIAREKGKNTFKE